MTKKYHLPNTSTSAIDTRIIRRTLGPKVIANFSKTLSNVDELDKLMIPIIKKVHEIYPKAELEPLMFAYRYARNAHEGQFRKSGDPYITHPIEVTRILSELGLDVESLCGALLHDTVEDTNVTYDDVKKNFGENVANLVEGVTKLSKLKYGENANTETIRKMIVAMSKDIRILVIKLADRLHNARTWKYVPGDSAKRKATETLEIYAPLAHRLGLNQIKRELEDLSFKTIHPKVYGEIESLVSQYAPQRDVFVQSVIDDVNKLLEDAKISAQVTGRPKHLFSVYNKMIIKGKDFHDIYDLVGIRIITNSILECYSSLGAIHAKYNHLPGRFKDYIAMPKYNMYQSIHTTVMGPQKRTIEIQIRTRDMHHFAQFGIAAHWKYKENTPDTKGFSKTSKNGNVAKESDSVKNLQWVKQLVDWQDETKDAGEFLDSLRFDLASDQVFVFTPKGEVIALTAGATPVDFSYHIHTEIGHKTMGAKINGRLLPLNTELKNGDTVEILTSKVEGAGPSRDWLNFVKTQKARNKIRAWLSKSTRESDIETGRDLLAKALNNRKIPLKRTLNHQLLTELADDMKFNSVDNLYIAIGTYQISLTNVIKHLLSLSEEDISNEMADEKANNMQHVYETVVSNNVISKRTNQGISVSGIEGENDVLIKLAKCCLPVPGDLILGFVTKDQGISVHRQDCFNISVLKEEVEPGRFIEASWKKNGLSSFLVQIQVEGLDRGGILVDITKVLGENKVNIHSGNVETTKGRVSISRWTFEIGDTKQLANLLSSIRKIDGVFDVYRIMGQKAPKHK